MVIYEQLENTLIKNTKMEKVIINGEHKAYKIQPEEGYIIHNKFFDSTDTLCYRKTQTTVSVDYDFTPITLHDENGNEVIGYGENELFCKHISEVVLPSDGSLDFPIQDTTELKA